MTQLPGPAEPDGAASDAVPRQGLRAWLALVVRGMAMGLAELVPGVSGGTIAFVTGIYYELVRSLSSFRPDSLRVLLRGGPLAFWREHNLGFLTVLALGMLISIAAFARLFEYLLDTVPTLVWGFFFGLIVASVVQIGRRRQRSMLFGYGTAGLCLGLALLMLEPIDAGTSLWIFFAGGVIAVSAWLLPAVSGSFMLLVLGLYEPVLRALNALDLPIITVFAAGCAVGILTMARFLQWLMIRFTEPLLALLTGFMAGSLLSLWPWRVEGALLLPRGYEAATGDPALVLYSVAATLAGMVALWLLSRLE
jgi:putative membrane protein